MNKEQIKTVPVGWKKGMQLNIKHISIHREMAWHVTQRWDITNIDDYISPKAIAAIWFYEFNELETFLKWWFTE